MPLVRVKDKYQVTLPTALRTQVGLKVGDLLEATLKSGKITLTPKAVIDRRIADGLQDIRKGRVHGPFASADDLVRSLHRKTKISRKSPTRQ